MATFDQLLKDKRLIPVSLKLRRGQFPERKIYAYPECIEWMREVPRMVTGRLASGFTPQEQLVERVRQWLAGDPMEYGRMFHDMDPRTDDVWENENSRSAYFWLDVSPPAVHRSERWVCRRLQGADQNQELC